MTENPQRYENPPIHEVVCEVHLRFSETITKESFSRVPGQWQVLYPEAKVIDDKFADITLGVEGVSIVQKDLGSRLIRTSEDGKKLVQISAKFLAINQLSPYPGWKSFRDTLEARLGECLETFPAVGASKISLRYIDRIQIPQVPLRWQDWFNLNLALPEAFQAPGGNLNLTFINQIAPDIEAEFSLSKTEESSVSNSVVLMNLNISLTRNIANHEILAELERIHAPHSLAFESILTHSTKELFQPSSPV